jgi:cob(I)alamin adenosyltransferase
MRIYTRGGDDGTTQLLGAGRRPKDDQRVTAYGSVDELNAALGLALGQPLPGRLAEQLAVIQHDLFTLGAELATLPGQQSASLPRLPAGWIDRLERWIDVHEAGLPPLRNFILPGGSPAAAALHLARCICRRAEREVVALSRREPVGPLPLGYLNRLSDFLFVASRVANAGAGQADVPWQTELSQVAE